MGNLVQAQLPPRSRSTCYPLPLSHTLSLVRTQKPCMLSSWYATMSRNGRHADECGSGWPGERLSWPVQPSWLPMMLEDFNDASQWGER